MNSDLLSEVKEYATKLIEEKSSKDYFYHTIAHTKDVVNAVYEISKEEKLSDEELEIVLIAAWFHDTGYTEKVVGHEEISAMYASNFLTDNNFSTEKIDEVIACILATKVPQKPNSLLQEVMCDADLNHLGRENFFERNELYKKELEAIHKKKLSEIEFLTTTIAFMNEHHFFTNYAKDIFQPQKEKNIQKLIEQLNSLLK